MKNPSFRPLGFTLVELLVVISIIGILSGIGIASYNEFNRGQVVAQTAEGLKSQLRLAQSRALAGEKDTNICGSGLSAKKLDGWYIIVSPTGYEIRGSCEGLTFGSQIVNLPQGLTLSPTGTISFLPLGKGNTEAVICIFGFGKTLGLQLSESGEISKKGAEVCLLWK